MALNLKKLRDLITFSREVPGYSTPGAAEGPDEGSGEGSYSSSLEGSDQGSGEGSTTPVRRGPHREATATGRRLLSSIPDMISSGITAAATPNIAGGGWADIFRGAAAGQAAVRKRHDQETKQRGLDALEQQRLSTVDWNRGRLPFEQAKFDEKAKNDQGALAVKRDQTEINRGAANSMDLHRKRQGDNAEAGNVIKAVTGGFDLVPPMAGHPAMLKPRAKEDLSLQQGANLDLSGAKKDLTEAQTETASEVPVHYITGTNDAGTMTSTAMRGRVKPGEAPAPLGAPLVQPNTGKTKPDPMVIFNQKEEAKRAAAEEKRAAESTELTGEGSKQMKETQSVARMFDDLLKKLEPYKGDNNPTTFTLPLAKYKLGVKSPEGELGNEISNLSLASIQGMMPFASKSRNYEFIKKIGEHLPRLSLPLPDSPALAYDKLSKARANFARFEAAIKRYEVKHATGDNPAPKLTPENAIVYVKAAGGDKKKAMQDAINDGWDVSK